MDALEFGEDAWQPLPQAARLGVELLYAKPSKRDRPLFVVGGGDNTTLSVLTLNCDPTAGSFALPDTPATRVA